MPRPLWTLARVTAALLLAAVLASCSGDDTEDYCATVTEQQETLSEVAASGRPAAVLGALESYRALQAEAPSDLADEWRTVVDALAGLDEALDAAGVDPASYDPEETPKELDDADRRRIEGAARHLGEPGTRAAMASIEQHALDICKAPLSR